MTLKEFLEYREHRFDGLGLEDPFYQIYAEGWADAIKDIRTALERNEVNLEIPLE